MRRSDRTRGAIAGELLNGQASKVKLDQAGQNHLVFRLTRHGNAIAVRSSSCGFETVLDCTFLYIIYTECL